MVKNLKTIRERDMLRSWAIAEASNPRRWAALRPYLPPAVFDKLRTGQLTSLSEAEWGLLEQLITAFRAPLLNGLWRLNPDWYEADLVIDELASLMVIRYQPFVGAAPSRKLEDLILAIDQGRPISDPGFLANLAAIRADFRLEKMQGRPILVAATVNGPYLLVEGYSRVCSLIANRRKGLLFAVGIPVILGVTTRIGEWEWS